MKAEFSVYQHRLRFSQHCRQNWIFSPQRSQGPSMSVPGENGTWDTHLSEKQGEGNPWKAFGLLAWKWKDFW